MQEYILVWIPFSTNMVFMEGLRITETAHFPLFLYGEDFDAFQKTGSIDMAARPLLYSYRPLNDSVAAGTVTP